MYCKRLDGAPGGAPFVLPEISATGAGLTARQACCGNGPRTVTVAAAGARGNRSVSPSARAPGCEPGGLYAVFCGARRQSVCLSDATGNHRWRRRLCRRYAGICAGARWLPLCGVVRAGRSAAALVKHRHSRRIRVVYLGWRLTPRRTGRG